MSGLRFESPDGFPERWTEERALSLRHQSSVAWRVNDDLDSSCSSVPFEAHHGVNGPFES
jgi:hypothetical protein